MHFNKCFTMISSFNKFYKTMLGWVVATQTVKFYFRFLSQLKPIHIYIYFSVWRNVTIGWQVWKIYSIGYNSLSLCYLVGFTVVLEHCVRKPGGQCTLPLLGQTRDVTFAHTICGPIAVTFLKSQWRGYIRHAVAQTTNRRAVFAWERRDIAVQEDGLERGGDI